MIYIYTLSSSEDKLNIRYIGLTKNPQKRISSHKTYSKKYFNKRANWIKSVFNNNYELLLNIIDTVDTISEAKIKEIYYIKYYKDLGYNLVNGTDGGDCRDSYITSDITRIKIKKALTLNNARYWLGKKRKMPWIKGREKGYVVTNETKLKISNSHKGKTMSDETKLKIKQIKKLNGNKRKGKTITFINVLTNETLIFNSQKEASEFLKCNRVSINHHITRNSKKPFLGLYNII